MRVLRGPQQVWAGSRPPGCARARDPGSRDALHLARSQVTSCGPGPGVLDHRRGVSYAPHSLAERDLGAKERRQGGSARVGPGKFLLRKTRMTAKDYVSSCEGKPGGRPKAEFQGALARTTAGATLLPLRAPVPSSLPSGRRDEVGRSITSATGQQSRGGER
jgi:hypothetical protein